MASKVIDFSVGSSGTERVLVEVEDLGVGNRTVGREEVIEKAGRTFEEVIEQIRPAIEVVAGSVRKMVVQPDQTVIEMGLKISASADVWIAKTSLEGNIRVAFTFKNVISSDTTK